MVKGSLRAMAKILLTKIVFFIHTIVKNLRIEQSIMLNK